MLRFYVNVYSTCDTVYPTPYFISIHIIHAVRCVWKGRTYYDVARTVYLSDDVHMQIHVNKIKTY